MNCRICNHDSKYVFSAHLLGKYDVKYFHCPKCSFLCTENPYWLNEAYKSPINIFDTGIIQRNISLASISSGIIYCFFDHKKIFLDFAGGYGIFTRMMSDVGFDFRWQDLYASNLLARGFEYSEPYPKIELITSFESFEHFVEPRTELDKMLGISQNILFSTSLIPDPLPKPSDWWYYGTEHGQHISFYSLKTLQFLAKEYGLNFISNGFDLHLFTTKQINTRLFHYLPRLMKCGLNRFIKQKLHSKTFDDMNDIIARSHSQENTPIHK